LAESTVSLIAVQRIGIPDRWLVIPVQKVAYAFLGPAATRGVIDAPWVGDRVLARRTVYVRTVHGALFRTAFSTIDGLRQRVESDRFVSIHRLVTANVNRIVELDFASNVNRIGLQVGNDVEFLQISRRYLTQLRPLIGFPKRTRRCE
jgi:hypothetical protein